ncbi:PadR family transcriptional regulator [Methanoregula sp.]|uniref:PadR family transcriptional regulator n=1 Tax=Methanoregula sp. TaxID=2052170 RepID=UPI0025F3D236|nr:PadR family transcriptional regulator [Methanoregula sp.]
MKHSTPIKISELLILGLLSHRPLSGYEIFRFMENKADSSGSWLRLNKTTVYNTLSRMKAMGHIRLMERIEEQNKPPKIIYEITNEGKEQLRQILLISSENPPGIFVNFYLDLPFYHILEKDEIAHILKHRVAQLEILIEASALYSATMPDSLMKILIDSQTEIFRSVRTSIFHILERIDNNETPEFFKIGEISDEKIFRSMKTVQDPRRGQS